MSRNAPDNSRNPQWRFLISYLLICAAATARAQDSTNFADDRIGPTAEIFVAHDAAATAAFEPRTNRVREMVDRSITNLTRKASVRQAWLSLVSTQDVVGIKVFSEPGPNSGTRPAVVEAVVQGLLSSGLPSNHIIIWDKRQSDLRLAGFNALASRYGVHVAGSEQAGYDNNTFYDTPLLGNLVWGDLDFGKKGASVGRKSFVSKLVSNEMTKIINISPLMNHNLAGVSGSLFSLALGSVDNTTRFESETSRLATAVPEIYALPVLSDRVVLNITDALICQYEGEERSLLHYSTALNQLWFSRDPVALDVSAISELEHQRKLANATAVKANLDLYHNASLLELGVSDLKRIHIVNVQ